MLKMGSRARKQSIVRAWYVKFLAKKMVSRLKGNDDHQTRIHGTNRLLPVGSLKRQCVRNVFAGWVRQLRGAGRLLTMKLSREVCSKMRVHLGMDPAEPPELEVLRVHGLLKQARKRNLNLSKPVVAAMDIDNQETLPYEAGGLEILSSSCGLPAYLRDFILILGFYRTFHGPLLPWNLPLQAVGFDEFVGPTSTLVKTLVNIRFLNVKKTCRQTMSELWLPPFPFAHMPHAD